ncbi:phage virion morphogenesis protein [Patulibacter medicamentivorans]|jgi:phage gpG-like protein|uniref:phage virion morphogenesis protein n=1 Tax=Patulibacter medicamentivorans TaxID=1097667 RepID=UPI00058EE65B|nr:phage virion morphogenesis protein [Patulibacter medicamentivorans]
MQLEISVLGEAPVMRMLGRVKHDLGDMEEAWGPIASILREATKRQFQSEGQYGSGGWAPLAPATLAAKRAKGLPPDVLQATGRMLDSLTNQRSPDHVERVHGDLLEWGTAVPYAFLHQRGTSKMPRRRPVEPPESVRREIVQAIQRRVLANESHIMGRSI